jgi:hypothetical protein
MTSPSADSRVLDPAKKAALIEFREDFFASLSSWGDALFELTDAVLCAPGAVSSVPSLSLEPVFRRSHGSVYKALAQGEIDSEALRQALADARPADWPLIFAVDSSTWDRCDAETSPERGFYYSASKHSAGQPIVAGWSYQWICQLNWDPDSWTAPLDATRIPPTADSTQATIDQVRALVDRLPDDNDAPMFVLDAGYDPIALTDGLADTRAQVLVRIRSDRVFYADPAKVNTAGAGRPRRHGRRFGLSDPGRTPRPHAELRTQDSRYGSITVRAWRNLHPKLAGRGRWASNNAPPIVRGTVIRVDVEHLPKPTRAIKTLWLWWSGPGEPDLDMCWRAYLRRFDIEHTNRFTKNTLGWITPSLRTPNQADRWTWLIVAAYTQLRLGRGLVEDLRLPWERPRDPAQLTPTRVRRGFRRLRATIGTPASPPKSDTPGPGRPKGTQRPPRTRYPAIKKAA